MHRRQELFLQLLLLLFLFVRCGRCSGSSLRSIGQRCAIKKEEVVVKEKGCVDKSKEFRAVVSVHFRNWKNLKYLQSFKDNTFTCIYQNASKFKIVSQCRLKIWKFKIEFRYCQIKSEIQKNYFWYKQVICQTKPQGWMVGFWDGTNLGWIPTYLGELGCIPIYCLCIPS